MILSMYVTEITTLTGQNAFEEGGVLHGKTVYLFGCTEREFLVNLKH